jgi:hypothetical protein
MLQMRVVFQLFQVEPEALVVIFSVCFQAAVTATGGARQSKLLETLGTAAWDTRAAAWVEASTLSLAGSQFVVLGINLINSFNNF